MHQVLQSTLNDQHGKICSCNKGKQKQIKNKYILLFYTLLFIEYIGIHLSFISMMTTNKPRERAQIAKYNTLLQYKQRNSDTK